MAECLNEGTTNAESQRQGRPIPFVDLEIVEKVKAGQSEAYGELVEKYQDRVFNAAWRVCGHLEDARDITQEAFVKAFENISSFRQQSGFLTWVYRIAVNLALSHRRKEHRRGVSLDPVGREGQAEALMEHAARQAQRDSAGSLEAGERQRALARALHELDEDQRAVVVLRDIEGLDYQEIGEVLGIPPGTVRSRLHRARNALRQAIDAGLFDQ